MPSFVTSSAVRDSTDGLQLVLNARHILIAGSPSDIVRAVKGRVPDDVDVILQSNLVISLSGTLNRVKVDARAIQCSAIAQHLLNYFHMNGEQLGVRAASKIFLDKDNGTAKLTLSPTRPVLETRSPYTCLTAIDLLYVCKTSHPQPDTPDTPDAPAAADPFSPHAFLPIVAALDRLVERFVVLHLVKRYPLIFGPWRERFDVEVSTSSKMARAVADIISRSPHTAFRKRSRRILKTLQKTHVTFSAASVTSLNSLLRTTATQDTDMETVVVAANRIEGGSESLDYHSILCQAMERILKINSKIIRYKGSVVSAKHGQHNTATSAVLDDDFSLSDCPAEPDRDSAAARLSHGHEGPDVRDQVELWFDEDAETIAGSQAHEEDHSIFFEDDAYSSDLDLDDIDVSLSDEAESQSRSTSVSSPQLAEPDEHLQWASSQSTLDDPMSMSVVMLNSDSDSEDFTFQGYEYGYGYRDLESQSTSRPTNPAFSEPDPDPRAGTGCSDCWDQSRVIVDHEIGGEDEWLDDPVYTTDQLHECLSDDRAFPQASGVLTHSVSIGMALDLAHNLHSSALLSRSGHVTSAKLGSHTAGTRFDNMPRGTEELTSYLPVLLDDDLVCNMDDVCDNGQF